MRASARVPHEAGPPPGFHIALGLARRVVVVGGGLTGAVFALHLARQARSPMLVQIVEPCGVLGAGVAYGTADPAHRVNVPASKMTLLPDQPLHFEHWLARRREAEADPGMVDAALGLFPRRSLLGTYVAETLEAAKGGLAEIRHVRDTATAVRRKQGFWWAELGHGVGIDADLVVLATGHPPPALPPQLAAGQVAGHPRVVVNPWTDGALAPIRPTDDVLILGTGLSMADVVASLELRGHKGRITAVSRHGLLSRAHERPLGGAWGQFACDPEQTASGLVRRVRAAIKQAAGAGEPWQTVVRAVIRDAQTIWAALPQAERHRLLRHARSHWDVHRYRVAPQVEDAIRRAQEGGRLEVLAASLLEAKTVGEKIVVAAAPRGDRRPEPLRREVDAVVVTTGPAHRELVGSNPVLVSLAAAGLLRSDPLGLGVHVDRLSRVLDAEGRPDDTLLAVGPLARGTFGELIAIPHIPEHAAAVAVQVADWVERVPGARRFTRNKRWRSSASAD